MPPLGLPKLSSGPMFILAPFLGATSDRSGYCAGVTTGGNVRWTTNGGVDSVYIGETGWALSTAALSATSVTLFFSGKIKASDANNYWLYKSAGVDLWFYRSSTSIKIYTGVASTFAVNCVGHTSVAVTISSGSKPKFYLSGAYVGEGSAVVSPVISAGELWYIFSRGGASGLRDCVESAEFYPSALSAPEIAQLHTWSQSRFTPRKQWPGGGLRYPDRGDPYTPATGDPLFLDNIQTARVTLANQTSGQLSNTGYNIESGTWKLAEDATTGERYIECVVAGIISRRNLEAYGTWEFEMVQGSGSNTTIASIAATDLVPYNTAPQTGWSVAINATKKILVIRSINGANTNKAYSASDYLVTGTRYRFATTKTAGNTMHIYVRGGIYTTWTLFSTVGGVGTNPFTDASGTTSLYSNFDFDAGDRLYLDNQFVGVLAPV